MKHHIFITFLKILPKSFAHKILYKKYMKKSLNLKNPKTLNEKIQWSIVYRYGKREGELSDKVLVKKYIQSLNIKDLYIPKTIITLTEEQPLLNVDLLPERFVLKTNHGSGDVFICLDKQEFDIDNKVQHLKKFLRKDYSNNLLEYHYSSINPVIMFEEYLDDHKNTNPLDYKFFCYDGYVDCVMVCSSRSSHAKKDFFDKEWNYLDYSKPEYRSNEKIEKPKELKRMFEIAGEISKGFPFVRVDLYNINGKIYFGEMTFTPAGGMSETYTERGDIELGKHFVIKK